MIRIGFRGIVYDHMSILRNPPPKKKRNSIASYLGPYITGLPILVHAGGLHEPSIEPLLV